MQTSAPTTWSDVERLPDDGNRYEWIAGRLFVTPAPSTRHQKVVFRLTRALADLLEDTGLGELLFAPCLVELPSGAGEYQDQPDRVQPDLLFVSRERLAIIEEKSVVAAPDLVVEVLSASTGYRDRGVKLDLYARSGVREYWIVDPDREVVDVWRFGERVVPDGAGAPERHAGELPVRVAGEEVGVVDLTSVFARRMGAG